jgi:hypothetical protein
MRRVTGALLMVAGIVLVLAGVGVAILFGYDDTATTRAQDVDTHGAGLVTVPRVLAYAGPRVEITAQAQDTGRRLFAGVAHDVDVRDYVGGVARTEVTGVGIPLRLTTKEVGGSPNTLADPTALDIWIARAEGVGELDLSFRLPDAADDLVILSTDGKPLGRLTVTGALVLPGVFVGGLAGVAIGVGLALVGWTLLRGRRRVAERDVGAESGEHS